VKELVSDVSVKNIDDYTRVTITTKKPLNIRASAQKTSAQQQEYSNLIAQVKNKPAKPELAPAPVKPPVQTITPKAPAPEKPIIAPHVPKIPEKPKAVEKPAPVAAVSVEDVKPPPPAPVVVEELPELPPIEEAAPQPPKPKKNYNHLYIMAGLLLVAAVLRFVKPKQKPQIFGEPGELAMKTPGVYTKERYHDIAEDNNLDWQEKYNAFKNEGNYLLINNVEPSGNNPFAPVIEEPQVIAAVEEEVIEEEIVEDEGVNELAAEQDITAEELITAEEFFEEEFLMPYERPEIKGFASTPVRAKRIRTRSKDRKIMNREVEAAQPEPVKPARNKITNPLVLALSKLNPQPVMFEHLGLVVKDAHSIDADKGFYIVDHNGEYALVGKMYDEVFVLKQFDGIVEGKIQVRQDKDNVYMVRAGGFKSLVEINDNKMGVLVEL
jgi:hypothetical protein